MRTFLCFPIPQIRKSKKNAARKNSAKVLDVSIWPAGEDLLKQDKPSQVSSVPLSIPSTSPPRGKPLGTSLHDHPVVVDKEPLSAEKPIPQIERIPDGPEQDEQTPFPVMKLSYVQTWVQSLVEFGPEFEEIEDVPPTEQEEILSLPQVPWPLEQPNPKKVKAPVGTQTLIGRSTTKVSWIGHKLNTVPLFGPFKNLKQLSLSRNSIVKIPRGSLPRSLQSLDLSFNQITTLDGLRGLDRLRVLNLSNNRISHIGQALRDCVSVQELYLNNNKINVIEGLHRLRKLFVLDLSNNRLPTLNSLIRLAANHETLEVLTLLKNPVMSIFSEERVRKFAIDIAPRLIYLNKQPLKAIPARDLAIVVGRFSRTEQPSARRTKKAMCRACKRTIPVARLQGVSRVKSQEIQKQSAAVL